MFLFYLLLLYNTIIKDKISHEEKHRNSKASATFGSKTRAGMETCLTNSTQSGRNLVLAF